ncbi:MAG: hypothetical protein KAT38_07405, partial [Bacteroidales bacterium]|nr:hypothetical protein [Bacteroidales bacterium]
GLFVFLTLGFTLWAQESDDSPVIVPGNKPLDDNSTDIGFFCKDEPFVCDLSFDIKKLFKEKYIDEYHNAKLSYRLNDSVDLEKTIRLKARGITRKRLCQLPPLKINLKKAEIQSGELKGIKKLKLVTCCKYSRTFEQYVLKEYMTYKLYNLLTDCSFRVRLIQIRYVDIGRKKPKEYTSYGFAIEDVDVMAERNNSIKIRINTLNQNCIDKASMNRFALFQFMIGNTDWSVPGQHNVKLLKLNDPLKVTPFVVPYDFDYSGFVNTHYSVPAEVFMLDNVRERLFRGICCTPEEYEATIQEFLDKKESIYQTILEFEYFKEWTRNEVLAYIDGFFRIIESDDLISQNIVDLCKKY